jgi:hypothetical protein
MQGTNVADCATQAVTSLGLSRYSYGVDSLTLCYILEIAQKTAAEFFAEWFRNKVILPIRSLNSLPCHG